MPEEKCYMCDSAASSVEHVPPKCLFPEFKDTGRNLRVNLITVPSCDLHNCAKSNDDEFLMVSIAGIIGNNSIGYEHYHGKIQRTLKRSSYRLLERIFLKRKVIRFENENKFLDILWGTPDYERLVSCFTHIAHGLYRHQFQKTFHGTLKASLGFLHSSDNNARIFRDFLKHKASLELTEKEKHGENQDVFFYQYTAPDRFGIFLVRLCFYQNVDVYVAYMPDDAEMPFDLGMQLMNSGMKTIFRVEDKTYEIN
ncbi:hypothetical protein ACCD10_25410 [Pseudomonas sp. Pseusp122]|uniref:hypothetical protein n=1 Tax=unclassified Pseudomonas TaxID=196821 RepID=UPI0039A6F035